MSDYITPTQFLEQPEKVQKTLKDWWNPQPSDLVFWNRTGHITRLRYDKNSFSKDIQNGFTPLFNEPQLRDYIQDKGYKYIGLNNFLNDLWSLKAFKSMMQFEPDIEVLCESPLECLFQVACKIAQEE